MAKPLVVLVEDNAQYRDWMKRAITSLDVELKVASNEEEGKRCIEEAKKWDGGVIFLMDVALTADEDDLGGVRLTGQIKETESEFKVKPTVVCTSHGEGDGIKLMEDLGVVDFIKKYPKEVEERLTEELKG